MNKKYILSVFLFCLNLTVFSQQPLTRILFILDASNSMNANWGSKTRMGVAKDYLSNSVEKLREIENLELALRVYGQDRKSVV